MLAATFVAHEKLKPKYIRIMAYAYAFFSVALLSGYLFHTFMIGDYVVKLAHMGADVSGYQRAFGTFGYLATITIFVVGTIGSVYFIYGHTNRKT